jgi:predicted nucleic acid-binding protein
LPPRQLVLDTNCFIDATRNDEASAKFEGFCAAAAPRLRLSSVVAAELRAGAISNSELERLEEDVLMPYERRGRIIAPSAAAWEALGRTLASLVREEGFRLETAPRSFIFDILIAYSCREVGAILVSGNIRDLRRIERVFAFDYVEPFPDLSRI